MGMPLVIYLDCYAQEEQESLVQHGLQTVRVSWSSRDFSAIGVRDVEALVRGPKLVPSAYADLCNVLARIGISPRTSAEIYALLSNSNDYEASIQAYVPEMRAMAITSPSLSRELAELSEWGQIFVRSELGSAAKFSGIESCLITRFHPDEIKDKIRALMQAHPTATQVVARRVVDVRKHNGSNIEGRFVVLSGQVRYLDYFEPRDLVERESFESMHSKSAARVSQMLQNSGIFGDYFLDIAEKENGEWFVVEIKPLLNGTIRNTALLANALLNGTSIIH